MTKQSGALSLVQILELLSSDWLNLTMLYAGAKVYAIITHLKALGEILYLSVCCYGMISGFGFHARKGSIMGVLMS